MAATIELVIFFVAPLVAIAGMMLNRFFQDFEDIKQNWPKYRCNPVYMPFAEFVQPEVSASMNFNQCIGLLSKEVLAVPMDSVQVYLSAFLDTIKSLTGKLNIFRSLRGKLAGVIMTMVNMTMGKLSALISTMSHSLVKVRDMMNRMAGTGYIGMLVSYTLFLSLKAFWSLAVSILRGFIYATIAIGFAVILFTFIPLALGLTLLAFFAAAGGFSTF
jgi:uncharacterized membrane protein (DUF485 family)